MRRSFGILLIIIGFIVLGINFHWWDWRVISWLLQFWPLLLVLIGLYFIFSDWLWSWVVFLALIIGFAILLTLRPGILKKVTSIFSPSLQKQKSETPLKREFYFYGPWWYKPDR